MKKSLSFIIPVLICFILGFIAARFQTDAIETWYPYLNKSSLTPPNVAFPIAWSILYICMGLSIGFILNSNHPMKKGLVGLFVVQLLLNFSWSLLFFYLQNPLWGLIDIILLDFLIIIYAFRSDEVSRISSLLFIPYVLWVTFAGYLNLYIFLYN